MSDLRAIDGIRPVDMPELRRDLVEQLARAYDVLGTEDGWDSWLAAMSGEPERLARAALFFVSGPMVQLAETAAVTLMSFQLQPEDLPASCGFMFFEGASEALELHDPGTGRCVKALAFSWEVVEHPAHGPGVQVRLYSSRDDEFGIWREKGSDPIERGWLRLYKTPVSSPLATYFWPFGNTDQTDEADKTIGSCAVLRSTWLLMQQPLGDVGDAPLDRSTIKRLRRAGIEERRVRVISLRRPREAIGAGSGAREWHHQWIVRGHWRQHWFPKRQVHRPVWIAPHVKGPEGAPMIGGEKVYALKK